MSEEKGPGSVESATGSPPGSTNPGGAEPKYKIQPWAHQLEAIKRARDLPNFALLFQQGTGKTSTAINILRQKFNRERRVLRTLILCPPIVIRNWKDEWRKYSSIPEKDVVALSGSGKQRCETIRREGYSGVQKNGKLFVTNYESLLMPELFTALLAWGPECLVLDESHKCKDPKSKRTKRAIQISQLARYKYILSGTPVLNSPLDLFSQFLILDGGETFGKNFFAFRGRYFRDKNAGMPRDRHFPCWEVMPKCLEEINELIYRKGMRVEKKDCLDLPHLVRQVLKVPLGVEQGRLYREMKKDFVTFLKDDACTATLAITKALRLMQIASGYVKVVGGEEIALEDNPKQEALKDLLEELTPNHKVLTWAVWKQNYEQIKQVCEGLGLDYVEVHGGITAAQKDKNVERFRTDPKCRVFIGHPGSAGIGLNLVEASYAIFYSRNFSLEQSLQAEARNHRGGSEIHEKITRIDLVTADSIDELVCESLANKTAISEAILQRLAD